MRLRQHEGIIPGRIDILYCRPDAIAIEEGYNVREMTTDEARAELDELKAQVKAQGILTPLKVRFDGENIILVEGHRRRLVALELTAEYEASGGTEGRKIEAVPIFPEAPGTTVEDRDAGLELSNSGKPLKPLERANLIYRMHTVRGLPLEEVAKRLGMTMQVLRNCLEKRAMPEEVKEQVRAGDVSATLAQQLVRENPDFAAKLIADNKAENERLGVGKRAKKPAKVTAKTIKRAKGEGKLPVPKERAPRGQQRQPEPADETAPQSAAADTNADTTADTSPAPEAHSEATPEQAAATPQSASPLNGTKALIEAVETLVAYANENSLDHFRDEDIVTIPFFVGDVKRAIVAHAHALEAVAS